MARLSTSHVCSEMQRLIFNFTEYFEGRNYKAVEAVDITSRIDRSVDLIGSHISVLKHFLESETVPEAGLHIVQPCIRTHAIAYLEVDDIQPAWGLFFRNLGLLVPPSGRERLLWDALTFLRDCAIIPLDRFVIQVSSLDADLSAYASLYKAAGIRVAWDVLPAASYRHTLGMEGIAGRNFNYCVEKEGELVDLGNFIIIEKHGRPIAFEVGLGNSSIIKEKLSLSHVCLAEPLDFYSDSAPEVHPKIYDAVISATHLLSEGVKPSSTKSCNRTLRSLLKGIIHLAARGGVGARDIAVAVENYERRYGINAIASSTITDHLKSYGFKT